MESRKKLTLLAQFDDMCRLSKNLFETDNEDISDLLVKSECNRLKWLDVKQQLAKANETIQILRSHNEELEIKLKRIRSAFGLELKKNEDKDKECTKLRNTVKLIRECITDENSFDKKYNNSRYHIGGSSGIESNHYSSNSDYHSGSYRDLMLSILNNSDEYNKRYLSTSELNRRISIDSSLSLSEEEELLFDKTEDDIHISRTNLKPEGCRERISKVASTLATSNYVSRHNDDTYLVDNNIFKRPNSVGYSSGKTASTYKVCDKPVSSEEEGPTSSKCSRNTRSPSQSITSDNNFGDNEDSINWNANEDYLDNCTLLNRSKKKESEEVQVQLDALEREVKINLLMATPKPGDQTVYMTPSAGMVNSANHTRALTTTIESRRYLLRSASCKKIKVDLTRLDKRPHNLLQKKVFKPMICVPCGKNIGFCNKCYVCLDCRSVCHLTCQSQLSLPCIPHFTPKGVSRNGNHMLKITDFVAPDTRPFVPPLLVHCCNEIDKRGLSEEGLYRKCGSDREIRELKSKFLLTKTGPPNIRKVDLHVLCGVVKMFLRDLDDPLITRFLWHDFARASDVATHGEEKAIELLKRSIDQLPDANRDSLAFLILHLQRIAEKSSLNRMTISSLGKIFGPSVIGHSSADSMTNVITENQKQIRIMQSLLSLPSDYWEETLLEPDIYKTPARTLAQHASVRKCATTGGSKALNALSPLSYRSATSSIYGTPAGNGRVTRYSPLQPCKLFALEPII